ncbi:MAG TPA: hypothetical protein VJT73_09680 [Polyangiaceae bacterium]|nr:hypothetical protein [Polyangiaceae bacterium]
MTEWKPKSVALVVFVAIVVIASWALKKTPRESAPSSASSAPPAASSAALLGTSPESAVLGASINCREIPAPPGTCHPSPGDPLLPIVSAANGYLISATSCTSRRARTPGFGERLIATVRALGELDPKTLPITRRIIAANALLRVGLCGPVETDAAQGVSLARAAAEQIHRFALTPAEVDRLGSEPNPEIAEMFGASVAWEDRAPLAATAFHERGYGLTKASRLITYQRRLVNLGQLVVVDTEWRPHVTPVVGSLEMRDPDPARANICAASLDLGWLACGAKAGLRPELPGRPAEDDDSLLFVTDRQGVPCRSCHPGSGPKSRPIVEDAKNDSVSSRRHALLAELSAQVSKLRAALGK